MIKFFIEKIRAVRVKYALARKYKVGKHHEKHTIRSNWRDDTNVLRGQRYF